jgi:hypothetical protein
MLYVANAFSTSMLSGDALVSFRRVSLETVRDGLRPLTGGAWTSAVGHADTAALFSKLLGMEVPVNRTTLRLERGDGLIVGQYVGPRLPEGATELPEGARIDWLLVSARLDS